MLASTVSDVAAVILATAALVMSAAVFRLVWKKGLKSWSMELPWMKTKLDAIDVQSKDMGRKIDQINTAVNHQPAGDPTLVQRVVGLETESRSHRAWEAEVMKLIGKHLGIDIPEPPPTTDHQQEAQP